MRYWVVCIGLMGLLGLRQVDTEITIAQLENYYFYKNMYIPRSPHCQDLFCCILSSQNFLAVTWAGLRRKAIPSLTGRLCVSCMPKS